MNANVTTRRAEPDIRDMLVVHRIFRREFPLLAEIVPRASNGDAQRAVHVARHIGFCLDSLHNHHSAEDEYLWPKLLERARPHAELVRRMEAQHEELAGCVEQARQLTGHWQAAPSPRREPSSRRHWRGSTARSRSISMRRRRKSSRSCATTSP